MSGLESVLFGIANSLLYPVLILLLLLFCSTLFWLGGFAREALQRRRNRALVATLSDPASEASSLPPGDGALPKPWPDLRSLASRGESASPRVEKFLADQESEMARRVERVSLVAKIGPMLGLAGTLIPLGPAL